MSDYAPGDQVSRTRGPLTKYFTSPVADPQAVTPSANERPLSLREKIDLAQWICSIDEGAAYDAALAFLEKQVHGES